MPARSLAIGFIAVLGLAGCGENHGTIAVRGRVTFTGKPPPAACAVIFAPVDAAARMRPGSATCASDGSFFAGSYRQGDGLLPGRYRALVRCLRDEGDETTQASSYVPRDFVPPEFDVPANPAEPVRLDIDIVTAAGRDS